MATDVVASAKRLAQLPLGTLDTLGEQLSFYIRALGWTPKTLRRYKREGAEEGWHFLTGDEASIKALADAVGFRYAWDEQSQQFAHASAVMVATPEGKLSHYFYGIDYAPRDLKLAFVEASEGKVGSPVDSLLLYCYHYDPAVGRFAPVMGVMRVAGVLTVAGLVALILYLRRVTKRREEAWEEELSVGPPV